LEKKRLSDSSPAPVVWFTGLSGAGKSTIAKRLADELRESGVGLEWLDGDAVRSILSPDLGFTRADRDLQVTRLGYIASLLARNGVVTIVSAISPYEESRKRALEMCQRSVLVHVDAPLSVLEARDTKGLYRRAREGSLQGLTGVDDPYESPLDPDLRIDTSSMTIDEAVTKVLLVLTPQEARIG
jgi:adenylylsulfate kinase